MPLNGGGAGGRGLAQQAEAGVGAHFLRRNRALALFLRAQVAIDFIVKLRDSMRQGYWVGCMVPLGNWMRRHSCPAAVSRSASLAVPRSPASSRSKAISTRRTPQRWKVAELQDKTESLAMSHDTFSRNTRAQLKQVFDALRELMTPATPPPLPKRPIGFLPLEDTQDKPKGAKAARGKKAT